MTSDRHSSPALRNVPGALLLDFGGVVVETSKRPSGRRDVAASWEHRLQRGRQQVDQGDLLRSLESGLTALKHWKHAQSRRPRPLELSAREVVHDFLAADLPEPARALLTAEASDVLLELTTTISDHHLRPGIPELLDLADARGIPVGIVSNAHSGRSHRLVLERYGIADRFAVQCYSDEIGLRKPHPGILELAAQALGTEPAHCWYVGDTQDRDVVAGRRAGVGAVVLTRSHHTDTPPFAVADRADAVFADPRGLVTALAEAVAPRRPTPSQPPRAGGDRGALLIDHGGVVSTSVADPEQVRDFTTWLAGLLDLEGGPAAALLLIGQAREEHRAWKRTLATTGTPIPETDPVTFWRDWFGATLDGRQRALLQAESHAIMARYARSKSVRRPRPGMVELATECHRRGMPIVVVSNTLSGRAVRDSCARAGLADLIAAYVCSDEVGARKPDPSLVQEALLIADADPALSWFVGDKPSTDARASDAAGVGHRVLVRGGATGEAGLAAALGAGLATAVVDDAHELLHLLTGATAAV